MKKSVDSEFQIGCLSDEHFIGLASEKFATKLSITDNFKQQDNIFL